MKKILAVILLLVTTTVLAAGFRFNFIPGDGDGVYSVAHDDLQWEMVAHDEKYDLYVNKGGFEVVDKYLRMHSMIVFHKDEQVSVITEPVKKIYSYGLVDCKNSVLFLISDFFTDSNNKVVWQQAHEMGSYITGLNDPGTPKYNVLVKMCGGKEV